MKQKRNIVWLDVARFLAMFFVVVSHAGDTFNQNAPAGDASYALWGEVWGSAARFCVPVFAMMTGFLLLPVQQSWGSFVRKRVTRVVLPFVFWSVLYCLLPAFVALCGGNADTLHIFVPFAGDEIGWAAAWKAIKLVPVNFCMLTTHLWYVYMLIGLYLVLPIFSPWYEKSTNREKIAFLALWGVSLFLPYARVYLPSEGFVWGECNWNQFGLLYGFSGFLGYALLGSVLGRMRALSWTKTLLVAIPLFTLGFVVTYCGYHHEVVVTNNDYDHYPAQIELFWTFCSPQVVIMSASVFLLAKKITALPAVIERALADINTCGFGIYCAHYAFIGAIFCWIVKPLGLPVCMQLPIVAFISYLTVWGFVHVLRRIPGAKRIV